MNYFEFSVIRTKSTECVFNNLVDKVFRKKYFEETHINKDILRLTHAFPCISNRHGICRTEYVYLLSWWSP